MYPVLVNNNIRNRMKDIKWPPISALNCHNKLGQLFVFT